MEVVRAVGRCLNWVDAVSKGTTFVFFLFLVHAFVHSSFLPKRECGTPVVRLSFTNLVQNSVSSVEFFYLYNSDWEKSVKDAEHRNATA